MHADIRCIAKPLRPNGEMGSFLDRVHMTWHCPSVFIASYPFIICVRKCKDRPHADRRRRASFRSGDWPGGSWRSLTPTRSVPHKLRRSDFPGLFRGSAVNLAALLSDWTVSKSCTVGSLDCPGSRLLPSNVRAKRQGRNMAAVLQRCSTPQPDPAHRTETYHHRRHYHHHRRHHHRHHRRRRHCHHLTLLQNFFCKCLRKNASANTRVEINSTSSGRG